MPRRDSTVSLTQRWLKYLPRLGCAGVPVETWSEMFLHVAPVNVRAGSARKYCRVLRCTVVLMGVLGLGLVDGVPKVQQQLNVHGHKDAAGRNPDAASPEQVSKLYQAVLGRPVDEHGAAHYQSGKGCGVVQVVDELLNSVEFRNKYSDDELVSKSIPVEYAQAAIFADVLSNVAVTELDVWYLYSRLFDRPPDATALAANKPIIETKSLAGENFTGLFFLGCQRILSEQFVRCLSCDGWLGGSDRHGQRYAAVRRVRSLVPLSAHSW